MTAPATPAPLAPGHTFALLDGLRGVAAILVVVRHAPNLFGLQPGAVETHLAVDLFFVLSGFVLAHAYAARVRDGLPARAFLRIRVIRLYPLYALGLALTVAVALLSFAVGQGPGFSPSALALSTLCSALMLPTPPAISTLPAAIFPLNFPSWSIFFELVANMAFFYGLSALSARRLAAFVALAFAGLCAIALQGGDLDVGYTWNEVHAGLIRVMFAFPVGVLLYRRWIARESGAPRRLASGNAGAVACLAALTLVLVVPVPALVKPVYDVLVVAFVFPALVYAAAGITPGPQLASLCLKAGEASYPLYILHAPCVAWVEAVGRRMPGVADRIAAPYAGLALLVVLLAACLVLVRVYDAPARRWLGRLAIPKPDQTLRADRTLRANVARP